MTSTAFHDLHLTNLVVDGIMVAGVRIVAPEAAFGLMTANEINADVISADVGDFGDLLTNTLVTDSIVIQTQFLQL